jgi:energy-coupling factor transporter ATP-binding protein EcfA2
MSQRVAVTCDVPQTPRVLQVNGIFDVPAQKRVELSWDVPTRWSEKPWSIGLIVGPSGSGKTTIARTFFPEGYRTGYGGWPEEKSILDGFPPGMSVRDIVGLLNHVGFSSPPSWVRPFHVLSTGEQFRVNLARALAEDDLVVFDEFTSVVDRTVAQVGSAAVAKAVRKRGKQFIAVTCHEDVEEWLQPDWVLMPATGEFTWRSLRRRPDIDVEIVRCTHEAWPLFRPHHYLSATLNTAAVCFLALYDGQPVAFSSWIAFPIKPGVSTWREHRTVCLPDYQGVGIGNAVSDFCASILTGLGREATSTTSHPAMIASRTRSKNWLTTRRLGGQFKSDGKGGLTIDRGGKAWREKGMKVSAAAAPRLTAGFRYVGPPLDRDLAELLMQREPALPAKVQYGNKRSHA